jgi:hypothetical protein
VTAEAGPTDRGAADPQDRAREGLEHLQAAARELIQAARAMLDVAEGLVDDPEAVAQVVGTVGAFGEMVRHVAGVAPRPRRSTGEAGDDAADTAGRPDLQRITVL